MPPTSVPTLSVWEQQAHSCAPGLEELRDRHPVFGSTPSRDPEVRSVAHK